MDHRIQQGWSVIRDPDHFLAHDADPRLESYFPRSYRITNSCLKKFYILRQ